MVTWHVWSDGSCQNWPPGMPGLGYGGWAAIVHHGSDGVAYRGRQERTTNVRMELRAATEGLSHVATGERCVLHIDCTVVVSVYQLWRQGGRALAAKQCRDHDEWQALGAQFDRVETTLDVLGRGTRPSEHRVAHVIAGSEARAGLKGLPANAVPQEKARRRRHKVVQRPIHLKACEAGLCVDSCPVGRADGPGVYESRRRSERQRLPPR